MTYEKNLSLIAQYRQHLGKLEAKMVATDYDARHPNKKVALDHLLSMLPQMQIFIEEGRRKKISLARLYAGSLVVVRRIQPERASSRIRHIFCWISLLI